MRIIGRRDLQDYFDFVGHRFGQDPGIVYVRKKITSPPGSPAPFGPECAVFRLDKDLGPWQMDRRLRKHLPFSLSVVVAGPHALVLLQDHNSGRFVRVLARDRDAALFETGWRDHEPLFPAYTEEQIQDLIRVVGHPVFRVQGAQADLRPTDGRDAGWVYVDARVPVLKDLGIDKLVPPEQMWQGIYSVLSNVLRKDPDKEPPCSIGNEDRIEAAGFDLKTSFRHPIKMA